MIRSSLRSLGIVISLFAASQFVYAQEDSPQETSPEQLAVSEDTRLLESTDPAAAIVPETPELEPRAGGMWQEWWNGEGAFADMLGLRSALRDSGFTFFGSYESNSGANVSGGRSKGATYADNFDFGIRMDLERIFGWNSANFTVSFSQRSGTSLTDRHVGNLFQIQQLFGVGTFMLYGVYLDQKFMDDRISLKIGRFATNDDFAVSPIYGLYMQNAFDGFPKTLVLSGAYSSYPGSVWAGRIRVQTSEETNASFGVYQTNDRLYNPNQHGFEWTIKDGDGVLLIAQVGWSPEFCKKPVPVPHEGDGKTMADGKGTKSPVAPVEMKGLPGNYWIGGYVSFWDVPQFGRDMKGDGPYAFYLHADQMVYQEWPGSSQGLTLWGDVVSSPDHRVNLIPFQVNGGVFYKGLIPGRDEDIILFGLAYGEFSNDYARAQSEAGLGDPSYEIAMEAGYRVQLNKFTYVMPEVQYINRPSGTGRLSDAVVLGLRVGITF